MPATPGYGYPADGDGYPGPAGDGYDPLAEDALPGFGDLLGPPGDPRATIARMRAWPSPWDCGSGRAGAG
jgi:hypothetical protein